MAIVRINGREIYNFHGEVKFYSRGWWAMAGKPVFGLGR
jgi:hypothetical protein